MAATIVTVADANQPTINISMKVNAGHQVPTAILTDSIQTFRTWQISRGHMFVWTNTQGSEMSMVVPEASIGWIISSMPTGMTTDRFRIDAPCSVTFVPEV